MKGRKSGGRLPGVRNRVTTDMRELAVRLFRRNLRSADRWLKALGEKDPERALKVMTRLAKFKFPQEGLDVDAA